MTRDKEARNKTPNLNGGGGNVGTQECGIRAVNSNLHTTFEIAIIRQLDLSRGKMYGESQIARTPSESKIGSVVLLSR